MKTAHKFLISLAALPLSVLLVRFTGHGAWLLGGVVALIATILYGSDLHAQALRATDAKRWSVRRFVLELPRFVLAAVCMAIGLTCLGWLGWTVWQPQSVALKQALVMAGLALLMLGGGAALFLEGLRGPPPQVRDWFSVRFDEHEVHIVARPPGEAPFEGSFAWDAIERVIFEDGGIYRSDVFHVFVRGGERAFAILTEGEGGSEFCGALCERGHFPPEIFFQAMGSTDGGVYVWPPLEPDGKS
ncbi:hypothetical protein K4L06_16320 [Lysobacter sp. BMK333-48F3]|uniref:hypothetical protein n=1 Tax=Lysobacter sp. BMK333-48F3 TaxID=2867962 RepID=UPI001C8C8453|nr:hypothetical protein [Lysobacter sp. BMK333-48F3]MBX9402876.1 hypothetical protein [Lysobacter sp. BMK333-48F3]